MLRAIFYFFFSSFTGFFLLLFLLFELHYFLRCAFYIALLKTLFKKREPMMDTFTTFGICTTNDLDILLHMNNSRYVREMDFNRIWFWTTSGLYQEARKLKGTIVQSACSIRYRKPITFLQPFKIELKVLYWDDRSMYTEQSFVTLHDGFVRAIALTKQTCVGPSMSEIIDQVIGEPTTSPEPTTELLKWMEVNELSSQKLRAFDRDQFALQPFRNQGQGRLFKVDNGSVTSSLNEVNSLVNSAKSTKGD